jgi:CRP-like cAMP-binding protein
MLALMAPEDFKCLVPHLELVIMQRGFTLVEADHVIDYVYFFETGIGSIIAASPEGEEVEAGLFGWDGFSPVSAILGSITAPNRIIAQVPGEAYRIARNIFVDAVNNSVLLRNLVLRFVQVLNTQASFTALSNAVHSIDERLARWLLMCHDRHASDDIPLTHEFLSIMLAVRRPSVTTALHVLEGNGFIRSERGYVVVRNRHALEDFAKDAYGKAEAEYKKLIGPMR